MALNPTRKIYRAALIGCGSMGSYCMDELVGLRSRMLLPYGHAEILKTHAQTELVAGADPSQDRLNDFGQRWEIGGLFTDHRAMLEQIQPEIVSIASPPDFHAEHVIDCAERGVKGIFCEKPLAPTLREADALIKACDDHGVRLAINHTRRGDPFVQQARQLIVDGEIGEILTISVTWSGRLFLSGTHSYDMANYFAGDIATDWLIGHAEEPDSRQSVVPTQRGQDIGGVTYIVYTDGVRALMNGRDGHPLFQVEISGKNGRIVLNDYDTQLWKRNESTTFRELLRHQFPQKLYYTAPMVYLLEDLMAAIETGRDPMSSGCTARHALAQILATHYSSQHDNAKVRFPFEEFGMTPPYKWFGEGGKAVNMAQNEGAKD